MDGFEEAIERLGNARDRMWCCYSLGGPYDPDEMMPKRNDNDYYFDSAEERYERDEEVLRYVLCQNPAR